MRIGVYVGSFNPVHKGHKYVIDYLINNDYVDKVVVIPTLGYWDKVDLLDLDKRIELLSFYESEKILINRDLNNISYTYQILEELKKIYLKDTLYLIMGADNIVQFHLWKNYDKILNDNMVIVLPRDGIDVSKYIDRFDKKNSFLVALGFKEMDISSTEIRDIIKSGLYEMIRDKLDDKIIDYIIDNDLYK